MKIIRLSTLLSLVCIIVACSGSSSQSATNTGIPGGDDTQVSTSLSEINSLVVGSIRLIDEEQTIPVDEAKQLLLLWQAYRSLRNSDTAAEEEVDGLLKQIQNTMTSKQIQAIDAMKLTSGDMMELLQSLGDGRFQGTPDANSTPGFEMPGGDFPMGNVEINPGGTSGGFQGGPPSGGAMPRGGSIQQGNMGGGMYGDAGGVGIMGGGDVMLQGTPDPSMQATAQARFSTRANQVNPMLLELLIIKLKELTTDG